MSDNFGLTAFIFAVAFMNVAGAIFSIGRARTKMRVDDSGGAHPLFDLGLGEILALLGSLVKRKESYYAAVLGLSWFVLFFQTRGFGVAKGERFFTVFVGVIALHASLDAFVSETRRFRKRRHSNSDKE